jgi:hypothetical protein
MLKIVDVMPIRESVDALPAPKEVSSDAMEVRDVLSPKETRQGLAGDAVGMVH